MRIHASFLQGLVLGVFLGVKSFASSNTPIWIMSAAESLARLASED